MVQATKEVGLKVPFQSKIKASDSSSDGSHIFVAQVLSGMEVASVVEGAMERIM